jgi:hypothetical protein
MRAWETWVDSQSDTAKQILWAAKKSLKQAWKEDLKDPKSYPLYTANVLEQIRQELEAKKSGRSSARMPDPKRVKRLSDLFPEKTVRMIWKDHHTETFDKALRKATKIDLTDISVKESWKSFKAIQRAMEIAYSVTFYGQGVLPRPRNNILHRGLSEIASLDVLKGLKTEAFVEFLDDLCPCRLKNHKGAARKMEYRSPSLRRHRS